MFIPMFTIELMFLPKCILPLVSLVPLAPLVLLVPLEPKNGCTQSYVTNYSYYGATRDGSNVEIKVMFLTMFTNKLHFVL